VILAQDIPRDPRAPSVARRMVDDLGDVIDPACAEQARLPELRCEVVDEGHGFIPKARDKPATDVGGWGLHLVETLSRRWGVREGSTHVWFELAAGGSSGSSGP
jgi:hypothetical protein